MSTPSPVPLDNFDPVSPYAPKWAREQTSETPQSEKAAERPRPAGIETDHDARILDEIEASLRVMIAAHHGGDDEPARLSEVSRIAAEQLAQQQAHEPPACPEAAAEPPADVRAHEPQADRATIESVFRDPRTPPWLLPRSLEPEPVPEPAPWPRRKRSRSNALFLKFGLAASGAAVVAAVAVKDIPALFTDYVRGPIADLTANAAAVFNAGKAPTLQARMDAVQKEQERASAPSLRPALANADLEARAVPVKTEIIARNPQPRRETVMAPWPSPEASKRSEPATVESSSRPAAPTQASATAPAADNTATTAAAAAPRRLDPEEVAMLRKMGDDYIAAGDFVGARAVLERAADAGEASAAFAIASTYDPVVLARFKVRGLAPDIVKAEFWYERARELGSSEAPRRLQAMLAARGN